MRNLLAASIFLLCSALGARADIVWERSYAAALAQSQATGKPLCIDFYTDWCGWCKKLDADVYPNAQVQTLARRFVMLKLDAEREGAPQARSFGVTGFPTVVFVAPQGQRLTTIGGYVPADQFAATMQSVIKAVPARAGRGAAPAASAYARQQALLRRASSQKNPGGAYLLDENGAVALDGPVKKPKARGKAARKGRKTAGY